MRHRSQPPGITDTELAGARRKHVGLDHGQQCGITARTAALDEKPGGINGFVGDQPASSTFHIRHVYLSPAARQRHAKGPAEARTAAVVHVSHGKPLTAPELGLEVEHRIGRGGRAAMGNQDDWYRLTIRRGWHWRVEKTADGIDTTG